MTQEEKELLLQDLCARLPYEVAIAADGLLTPQRIVDVDFDKEVVVVKPKDRELIAIGCLGFEDFKPYLRPMSSMTENEKQEIRNFFRRCIDNLHGKSSNEQFFLGFCQDAESLDYLNMHHLDYRGLIEKGLALEAPKGMYNF